jgi:TonB family protein
MSRIQLTGVAAGLAALAVIGSGRMFEPRWTYKAEEIAQAASPNVNDGKPIGSEYRAVSKSPRPFLVEVLDASNQRRLLSFVNNSSMNAARQDAFRSAMVSSAASLPRAGGQNGLAASARATTPHNFTLIAPNVSRPEGNNSAVNSPSIAPPLVRGELPAPLEALITGLHTSHAIPAPIAEQVSVGGQVQEARLLKSVPPVYPGLAKSNRVTGEVTLDALIDAAGNVTAVRVISGPTLLQQAAIEAVRQWKYEAARLDGRPVAMHLWVTVKFHIG